MNPGDYDSSTNAGGWKESHMRKTILGSDSSPLTPKANTFLAALPRDLRAVMKSCTKYTNNVGDSYDNEDVIISTEEYLWLLSEFEVFGEILSSNMYASNYQLQYSYYNAGNSKKFHAYNSIDLILHCWLRSVSGHDTDAFLATCYDRESTYRLTTCISAGVAPVFCV